MISKNRFHFIELQDLHWFPQIWRNGITDYLHFLIRTFHIYRPAYSILSKLLKETNQNRIVDLCAGGGGASVTYLEQTSEVRLTLTDLYPNLPVWSQHMSKNPRIESVSEPVNALQSDLLGLRTLFTSFHHFKDEEAKQILKNAYDTNQPIAVFEFTQRNWKSFLLCLPSPFFMFFLLPFSKPRLSSIAFTYLVPVIPFVVGWDILVSVLRSRSKSELLELVKDMPDYQWDVEEMPSSLGLKVIGLYGKRK